VGRWWHLAKRFVGSLRPGGPSRRDVVWVISVLSEAEFALWARMSAPDRRHSVAIAREVDRRLGDDSSPAIRAAALLHDVGKIDAGLGTWGRVVATLAVKAAGPETADVWIERRGFTRRVGLYVQHPRLGGDMLELAGSDPLTVAWTREHHLPESEWTVAPRIARVLHEVDDD
jgi:hypothetical protein